MDSHSSILDIDVGNSRIKWRLRANDSITRGAIDREHILNPSEWPKHPATRIRVSSVASQERARQLSVWLQSRFGTAPEFARTARFAAGLTCGYEDPSRLGVDRWLAMLAARQLSNRPFIVFGLGTAGTADFVDDQGMHKGGFIVPGLRLMTEALFEGTADVHVTFEASTLNSRVPGRSTPSAVRRGVALMLADFVSGSISRFSAACADTPLVYLSGGDAEAIARLVEVAVEIRSELVLDDLTLALP